MKGTLEKSIYQAYSPDNSNSYKSTYHVSWRMAGGRGAPGLPDSPYGMFVEFGLSPIAQSRKPFLRQALDNKSSEAVTAMEAALAEYLK
jgi:hypothetical protein